MNQNPWQVENEAQYERERIRQEMRQIRLVESARRVLVQRPPLVARLRLLVRRWFAAQQTRQGETVPRQPAGATSAGRQIRI